MRVQARVASASRDEIVDFTADLTSPALDNAVAHREAMLAAVGAILGWDEPVTFVDVLKIERD